MVNHWKGIKPRVYNINYAFLYKNIEIGYHKVLHITKDYLCICSTHMYVVKVLAISVIFTLICYT